MRKAHQSGASCPAPALSAPAGREAQRRAALGAGARRAFEHAQRAAAAERMPALAQ